MNLRTRCATLALAALSLSAMASAQQVWRVTGGSTTLSLSRQYLHDLGLEMQANATGRARGDMEEGIAFAIDPSATSLAFTVQQGAYRYWNGGQVTNKGGVAFTTSKGKLSLSNFSIVFHDNGTPDNMFIKSGNTVAFQLTHIKVMFDRNEQAMTFGFADMVLTQAGAEKLGRPDLAGRILGMATVSSNAKFVSGDPNDEPPPTHHDGGEGDVPNGDVMLWNLGDCTSYGRIGTYPNGISGLGVSTTSCNVSTVNGDNVNWYQQMDERHPVIAQNFYRVRTVAGAGTRFEQIGVGWVKHGFLATNSGGCGSCQNPGTGALLGVRCSDTYGSNLNASRSWLGPRNEVNAFTGRWRCTGSYFSGYQNDCVSRFNTNGLNAVDHRLQVADQDLVVTGSQFFYEAYYVSENDIDRYNNAAYRPCTVSWSGSTWSFTPTQAQTQGVAIDHWGDLQPAPRAQPQTEGDILVACQVTDLGNGRWHYEYAMYNHSSNREVRQFTIPMADGLDLTNIEFRDIDTDSGNQWTSSYANKQLTFSTQTYGQNQNANSLKWYSVFNFRFDANTPPTNSTAVVGLFRPGTLQSLTVATRAPGNPNTNPTAMNVGPGSVVSGSLADLLVAEDSRLMLRPTPVASSSQSPITVILDGTTSVSSPTSLMFKVEGNASAAVINQKVELYNYTTGQWVTLDSNLMQTSDAVVEVTAPVAADFVQAGSGAVRARLTYKATAPVATYPWSVNLDQAVWTIN